MINIQFLGATQTVTGSKYLLKIAGKKILIDCGLFQGLKELRLRNWAPLPFDAQEIEAVLLTHAHLDHSGYLPLLIKNGFKGPIWCTSGTYDLCKILLPDSGYLQEEEAAFANKNSYSKHSPALPLYTSEDAEKSLKYFKVLDFYQDHEIFAKSGVHFKFLPAGHILGASTIQIQGKHHSLVFSGDLGRPKDPLLPPPVTPNQADFLVIESTYGDRIHSHESPLDQLEKIINRTYERGGSILIPAFAVGRAQSLLFYLHQLKNSGRIPPLKIYLDSPMATQATHLFEEHMSELAISNKLCEAICTLPIYVESVEKSKELLNLNQGIIISASGMATGGRVLHHLKNMLPNPKNTILFSGYQAAGTRGAKLISGARSIKMLGQPISVNAEIQNIDNLSAHADQAELISWLKSLPQQPKKLFITHGESSASDNFKILLQKELNWNNIIVPQHEDNFEIAFD